MCHQIDLAEEAVVTPEEASELAEHHNLLLFKTSVKDDLQVSDVFRHLTVEYITQEQVRCGACCSEQLEGSKSSCGLYV